MYEVNFYQDRNGKRPALAYLQELLKKNDKGSRIRARRRHRNGKSREQERNTKTLKKGD